MKKPSRRAALEAEELLFAGRYLESMTVIRSERQVATARERSSKRVRRHLDIPLETWRKIADSDSIGDSLYNLGAYVWAEENELLGIAILRCADESGSDEASAALGEALVWMQQPADAKTPLEKAIEKRTGDWRRAAGFLGSVLLAESDSNIGEVIAFFRIASESGSRHDDRFGVDFGKALIRGCFFEEAKNVLESESDVGNSLAPIALGNLLQDHFGDNHGADLAYRRGLELGDGHSAYNLSLLLKMTGSMAESAQMLRRAAKLGVGGHGWPCKK